MFGFNWVDAIIVVLLAAAVAQGLRIGLLAQIFTLAGFFVTLFIAGWLFPHLVRFHDPTLRTLVNASLVLVSAGAAAAFSADLGQDIHWSFRLGKLRNRRLAETLETALGVVPALVGGLTLVWLLGVMIGRLPFAGLSNSVSDARIVQQLTRSLPPVPAVFAEFDRQIDPTAQPYVFVNPLPQIGFNYSASAEEAAEAKGQAAIVRITSFSCGGIVSGTGFAVGRGLVATNAHVIAGAERSIIKYQGSSYESTPVYFDANLDLAILSVPKLTAPPLGLVAANVPRGTTGAVLGYPGGNYRAVPGLIRDTRAVSARSIYDQGEAGRGIYEVQADVNYGNSGSPLVLANGQVAGIMFSKSVGIPDNGFALTSAYIAPALHKAAASHTRISTGACMLN